MPIEVNGNPYTPKLGANVKRLATFKVSTPPHRAQTEKGEITIPKASLSFPCEYTRINPSTRETETWRYFESKGYKVEGNVTVPLFTPEDILIERGEIKVNTLLKPDLYEFLRNDPRNRNSVQYDTELYGQMAVDLVAGRNNDFLYFEVKEAKNSKQKMADKNKIAELTLLIGDDVKLPELTAYALYKAYNLPDSDELYANKDFDVIRERLVAQMEANPTDFEKKMSDAGLMLRARIADAIAYNVLTFDQYTWKWDNRITEKKKKDIVKVPPHQFEEKEEVLLDFLRTSKDGMKIAEEIKTEIINTKNARLQ